MTITTTLCPSGVKITGIRRLAGILRGCPVTSSTIQYQALVPRAGGALRVREHIGGGYTPVDHDEVALFYTCPRTMRQIAADIRDALDKADAMDACR